MRDIAVLVAAYNGEKYISLQIESILKQTVADRIDIIVRDDGSRDATCARVRDLMRTHDHIRLLEESNVGMAESFFRLLRAAAGQYRYYCLSDQDDYWLPEKVETAVEFLSREDDGTPLLYACPSFLADDQLNRTGKETKKKTREFTFYNTIHQTICTAHNQVLNDALVRALLEKELDFSRISFHDNWTANVAGLKGKILFDNTSHALYRMHNANVLGYGHNKLQWFTARLKRAEKNEGGRIFRQIAYFLEVYGAEIGPEERAEIQRFLTAQNKGFFSRLHYALHMKLYRQSQMETLLMKLLYCAGGYRF